MSKRPQSGFTLIELLIVVAIIVVLAGMMVPVLQSSWTRAESRGAVTRVTNMMTLAASMAAAEGQTFRLNFSPQAGRFWLTWEPEPLENPGVFAAFRSSRMTDFRLEDTALIPWHEVQGLPEDALDTPYIEFRPDGTADRATLVLATNDGGRWTIILSPVTASVRIFDFDITEETL
ncbi:MAG: hypothetical protein PWP23_1599 [Candidatus Sumerlaeota bacterium]|nr:hypothetical protein [Candidatus Sumerlaeota bacterium]